MNELTLLLDDEKLKASDAPARREVRAPTARGGFRLRIFTAILAQLLKGGIPLLQALEILEGESERKRERGIIASIKEEIRQGKNLSEVMGEIPALFPPDLVHAARAGEASGALDTVLEEAAAHLGKKEEAARKIKEASAYPCLILAMGLLTLFVLLKTVVPKIAALYSDLGGELPGITKVILAVSRHSALITIAMLASGILTAVFFSKNRERSEQALSRLPVLGRLYVKAFLFNFTSSLALLLKSGVPVFSALQIMSEGRKGIFPNDLEELRENLSQGKSFSNSLKKFTWMTGTAKALIRSGEESGRLPESLAAVAAQTEREIETGISTALRLIEPLMIMTVGLMVGIIVVGTILPVFEMNGLLK